MNNIEIYGIINEDREIVFISDYQPVDWDPDYWIEEDADWKIIKTDNSELMNEIDGIHWDSNIVILERIDTDEEGTKEALSKWIDIIKPKYILDYINSSELMDFRIRKEKEWEEEDKKFMEDNKEVLSKINEVFKGENGKLFN